MSPSPLHDAQHTPTLSRRDLLRLGGLSLLAPLPFLTPGPSQAHFDSASYRRRHDRYPATIADARAAIAEILAGGPATAVSVALVDGRRILWAEAFGWLDRAWNLAPNPDTLFGLASGSKMLATIAAMLLVERGLVELDAPLVRYLPGFRMADGEAYDAITVRMLLDHSSGLPGADYRNCVTAIPVSDYAAQVLDTLSTQRLKHAPGTRAMYCNDGFTLIEPLVTAVTGQSYTDFVALDVLLPLGMTQSRFALHPLAPGSFAPALDPAGRPLLQEYANPHASGGLYTTPSDMGRLAMMLLNGGRLPDGRRLLSAWSVREMGRSQTRALPLNQYTGLDDRGFGLGWDGTRHRGLAAVGVRAWHKGGDTSYHTQLIVAPDERLAVMVMDVSGQIAPVLAERILLNALAERGRIAGVPRPLAPNPGPVVPSTDADLDAMVGCYASVGALWRLEAQADRSLTLSSFSDSQWQPLIEELRLRQDGHFAADNTPGVACRTLAAEGRRYLIQFQPGGLGHYEYETLRAEELPPGAPLSPAWRARLGRRWLLVNDAYSLDLIQPQPQRTVLFTLEQAPDLDSYLIVNPMGSTYVVDPQVGDDQAGMCLGYTRDVNDLVVERRDGEEWLRWGSYLHRPLETVPFLAAQGERIVIGAEGLGEWRRVPADAVLTIGGATIWHLYDAAFGLLEWRLNDNITVSSFNEAWLFVHGDVGQVVTIRSGGLS